MKFGLKLRVSTYFVVVLLMCNLIMSAYSLKMGVAYFVSTLPILLAIRFTPQNQFRAILIALCGGIWAFFLIRPLFLIWYPETFLYVRVFGIPSEGSIVQALFLLGAYIAIFLSVFYLFLNSKLFRSPSFVNTKRINHSSRVSLLERSRHLILWFSVIVTGLRILLLILFRTGAREEGVNSVILLLLPINIILPLAFVYLWQRYNIMSWTERGLWLVPIIGESILEFFGGSKSFALELFVLFLLQQLILKGDFKLPIGSAIKYFFSLTLVTVIAFWIVATIRNSANGLDFRSVENIVSGTLEASSSLVTGNAVTDALDLFTRRMVGFDGFVIVNSNQPPEILRVFSIPYILKQYFARLLPFVSSNEPSLGRSIILIYRDLGHLRTAGALGLFGAIHLFRFPYFALFVISGLSGLAFKRIHQNKDPLLRNLWLLILLGQQIRWFSSGNFDSHLQEITIIVFHIFFYGLLLKIVAPRIRRTYKFKRNIAFNINT